MNLDPTRINKGAALLETMVNRGRDVFYKSLNKFFVSKGLDMSEFNPYDMIKKSDDDNVFLKASIQDVPGFDAFIAANNMIVARKNERGILLKPINNNEELNVNGFFMHYFDSRFHNSDLYHLAPSSNRESILRNGLRPKAQKFGETERGFETYDPRIYLIVADQVAVCDLYGKSINTAIALLLDKFNERYPGSGPYDVWKVTLPENIELHRDASFECGAYIKNSLPTNYIELVLENVSL